MRSLFIGVVIALLAGCQIGGSGTCLSGGKVYQAGANFPASDGCNTCSCGPQGDVACTLLACQVGDAGDSVMCVGMPQSFPTFDKHCAAATDCALALHVINCCGSAKAIGINQSEVVRFDRDEKICDAQYPKCGCPTSPPIAEDGKTSTGGNDIKVDCRASACTTFIP